MAAVLRHSSITAEPRDERLTEGIMNIHVKLTKQTITIPHHKGDDLCRNNHDRSYGDGSSWTGVFILSAVLPIALYCP